MAAVGIALCCPALSLHGAIARAGPAPPWVHPGSLRAQRSQALPALGLSPAAWRAEAERPRRGDVRMRGLRADGTWEQLSEASEAIGDGVSLFAGGDYDGALALFEKALDLPGAGTKKDRAKPAVLSPGEKQAAFFNIACCHSRLGNSVSGISAVNALLSVGYGNWITYGAGQAMEDYKALTSSEDLAFLRESEEFEALLTKYKVVPSRMAVEMDFSNSTIGRAAKMWGGGKR
mmetsp:Transcript_56648/g.179036  ORF Transcript_56648/g.179036 Transcript_56648/m.179036 type:complete len:233 (-) Transcript_56648:210-908(-)